MSWSPRLAWPPEGSATAHPEKFCVLLSSEKYLKGLFQLARLVRDVPWLAIVFVIFLAHEIYVMSIAIAKASNEMALCIRPGKDLGMSVRRTSLVSYCMNPFWSFDQTIY